LEIGAAIRNLPHHSSFDPGAQAPDPLFSAGPMHSTRTQAQHPASFDADLSETPPEFNLADLLETREDSRMMHDADDDDPELHLTRLASPASRGAPRTARFAEPVATAAPSPHYSSSSSSDVTPMSAPSGAPTLLMTPFQV
jgi:hypothetical protein